jgi:hypothetical protein
MASKKQQTVTGSIRESPLSCGIAAWVLMQERAPLTRLEPWTAQKAELDNHKCT